MTASPSSPPSRSQGPPLVAIVGRPNVGKSTLFNRLLGRRHSITDSIPGVTRDPVGVDCTIGGRQLRLVDTGGFRLESDGLDAEVSKRSLEQVRGAALVLLVMDVDEITAEDEGFIEVMRSVTDRVVVVVNKVDGPEKDSAVWNFHSYGFEEVVGISAEHRRNIDALTSVIARRLPARDRREPDEGQGTAIRLSILGKPNTGKSTLMNRLTGKEHSLVSDLPGTTRDVIEGDFEYKGQRFTIVDTAGIRRKNKVEENLEYYSVTRAIATIDSSDIVLLVIDAELSVTDQDKKLASLAIEKGKGVALVLNKWDLLERVPNLRASREDRVRFLFPVLDFAPVLPISAATGEGVDELLSALLKVWRQLNTRVDTSKVNKAMKGWNEHYSPPRDRRSAYRVRYITQTGTNPVTFILFVNKRKGFPAGWVQYLTNRIRKDFGFASIPVAVELRERQ